MAGEDLTALIGAYEPGPGGLRALLPLAGATLVEHQARRAVAAGAANVLLLIDEVPAELAAAIGRLRQDGMRVALAQGVDAAADALLDQRVLLIADACLPDTALLRTLAVGPVPSVAVLADLPDYTRYERIDAEARWAGAALIDGPRVAETAAMLGSWDPVFTLLRRAVQEGAARLPADQAPPTLLLDADSIATAERAIVEATRERPGDWIGRYLFMPAEELALPALLSRRVEGAWLCAASAALALLGGAAAWFGWQWTGLVMLLLSGPLAAGGSRLARVQARVVPFAFWLERARLAGVALGGLGVARTLALTFGQWGWWLVGGGALLGMAALASAERIRRMTSPAWTATADGLCWAVVPFALAGKWGWGLAATALYAAGSFVWVQRLAVREAERD